MDEINFLKKWMFLQVGLISLRDLRLAEVRSPLGQILYMAIILRYFVIPSKIINIQEHFS